MVSHSCLCLLHTLQIKQHNPVHKIILSKNSALSRAGTKQMLVSCRLQSFTGGPDQEVSCEPRVVMRALVRVHCEFRLQFPEASGTWRGSGPPRLDREVEASWPALALICPVWRRTDRGKRQRDVPLG